MLKRLFPSSRYLILFLLVLAIGCKEGDPDEVDPVTPEPEAKKLVIEFSMANGDEVVLLDQSFTDENGQWILPTEFKLYLSNLELVSVDFDYRRLSDIELIDFEPIDPNINNPQWGSTLVYEVESGSYNFLEFAIGVDPDLNGTDPATYENEHPLSIFSNMYWSWASMYRFLILEGRGSSTGVIDDAEKLVYHIGTDPLYEALVSVPADVNMDTEENDTIHVVVDLAKLFDSNDGIDISQDQNTHTVESQEEYDMAVRFMDRFAQCFTGRQ